MDIKKITIIIVIALGFFIHWSGQQLSRGQRKTPLETDESFVNFVIPKLKEYIPGLFLWDRSFVDKSKYSEKKNEEIENVENTDPNSPKTAQGAPVAPNNGKPTVAGAALPKPGLPNPNLNKNPTSPVSPEAESLRKEVHSKMENGKTQDHPENNMNNDGNDTGAKSAENNNAAPIAPADDKNTNVDGNKTPSHANNERNLEESVSEWKSKFLSHPTKELMNEFVHDYQNGKVRKKVFYQVESELIKENNPEMQNIMIYGLASTPSKESLSLLLESKEEVNGNSNSYYKLVLDTYAKEDKLKVLFETLKSDKPQVVLGTIPLVVKVGSSLVTWTSDFSSQSEPSGEVPRDRRGHSTGVPRKSLIDITNALNNLVDSHDNQIASAVRDALVKLDYNPNVLNQNKETEEL